jgi:hypothetical protein
MTDARKAELYRELPFLNEIGDAELKGLIERTWLRLWRESGLDHLADAPWFTITRAERSTPTALVEHIRQVAGAGTGLAEVARRQGSKPDMDLLLTGAALIDVDKLIMTDHKTGEPSDAAHYSQHTFYGAHAARAEGASWPVVHMILSHSKNTGVRPRTLEAVILHYADYAVFDLRNIFEGQDRLAAEEKPKWSRA